jgi:hypothetical protein
MSGWDLLDEKAEADLHKARLLNVEEKPFRRVAKRVASVSSLASSFLGPNHSSDSQKAAPNDTEQLKEDFTLDFAAFDSSITRLQFLLDANARERERYQADKQRIMAECQSVRDNNAQLREQLESARATLAQRKKFDELAEKITSNRMLRPREDQVVNLAKLEEECRELERESQTYSETWTERRDQFNRIMEEGMLLRRQIRDEKEEVDRREGMNEGAEDEDEADKGGRTPRHEPSGGNTPRPDGEVKVTGEADTPRPDTPAQDESTLKPGQSDSLLQPGSRSASRAVSPASQLGEQGGETKEDAAEERQDQMEVDN